jgi:hypothetical protein
MEPRRIAEVYATPAQEKLTHQGIAYAFQCQYGMLDYSSGGVFQELLCFLRGSSSRDLRL